VELRFHFHICVHDVVLKHIDKSSFCVYILRVYIFTSRLLSKNIKIKLSKTIILPVVLYACETVSDIGHGLGVFENRVLRRVFGPAMNEITGGWRKRHNESFVTCTLRQI
jgi:hypothetical protein